MNSRQRILTAFAHKQPDRCPTYIWIDRDAMENLMKYLVVSSVEEAQELLGIDKWCSVGLNISKPDNYHERIDALVPSKYKNNEEFRVRDDGTVDRIHKGAHYLRDTVFYPINRIEDLDLYPLPEEDWIRVPDGLEDRIRKYKDDHFVVSCSINQIFKSCWFLRGMSNLMMDFLANPDLVNGIYERMYSFETAKSVNLAKAGVDMIQIIGDIAMQNSLMMSPKVWREFDKWRLERLISTLKGINPELKIYMHTDGDVREIIEDLIEVGLDILNPIQPECMSPVELKRQYGDKLVLHGAVSLQKTLPFGTPSDVREEVRYLIENCNVDGGFVIGPSNGMFRDIPPENIVAMYEAVY